MPTAAEISNRFMEPPPADLAGGNGHDDGQPLNPPIVPAFVSVNSMIHNYPELRPAIIQGVLRQGETASLIASAKAGKTFLAIDLALAIATGRDWLGHSTVQGDVLYIDNELHPNTLARRFAKVMMSLGMTSDEIEGHLYVENLRGRLQDIYGMHHYFEALPPGRFAVIFLDAWYRFVSGDENNNADVARMFNAIDQYAKMTGSAFVCVHHHGKGSQSERRIVDVGAGASAMARASDSYVILREHEEDGAYVMEAAVRSWPPIEARGLRWEYPLWRVDSTLDPTALRKPQSRRKSKTENVEDATPPEPPWTAERFVEAFVMDKARTKAAIVADATEADLSVSRAKLLLGAAEDRGLIHKWTLPTDKRKTAYATIPEPEVIE